MQLNKHPILMDIHNLIIAIEECGCSEKLTAAVTKAVAIGESAEILVDAVETMSVLRCGDVLEKYCANREWAFGSFAPETPIGTLWLDE